MKIEFTITDPERREWWLEVIGTDRVQITGLLPQRALLPGLGEREVYKLKVDALSDEQRERLCDALAAKFNVPLLQAYELLHGEHGVPILAEHGIISCDRPWFL